MLALVALFFALASGALQAAPEPLSRGLPAERVTGLLPVRVSGIITDVDFARFPHTLTLRREGRTEVVNLHRHSRVFVSGEAGSLADLREGLFAVASIELPHRNARMILVDADPDAAHFVGRVENTRNTNSPGTPTSGEVDLAGNPQLSLATDIRTELRVGPIHLAPEQLHLLNGFPVTGEVDPQTLRAHRIVGRATGRVESVEGRVVGVDHAEGVLLLGPGTPREFVVADGARVALGGHSATWPYVVPGDRVRMAYIPAAGGRRLVLGIAVQGVHPRGGTGLLRSVDLANERVLVEPDHGPQIWVYVPSTADLKLDQRTVRLDQLAGALGGQRRVRISSLYFVRGDRRIAVGARANTQAP